jgi:hypothetical protein
MHLGLCEVVWGGRGVGVVKGYGIRVYRYGVDCRTDGRRRRKMFGGGVMIERKKGGRWHRRGQIRIHSRASARRLAFVAANAAPTFRTFITLTYRGRLESEEGAAERNLRLVRRSKADLHRFIVCLRRELGDYVWVQEFQKRGAVHYHLLCTEEVVEGRVAEAWLRAIGALGDEAARCYGVKVEAIRGERQARRYLGVYISKARAGRLGYQVGNEARQDDYQKSLPLGVSGAGRWWGATRSLKLQLLEDVVTWRKDQTVPRRGELNTVRCVATSGRCFVASSGAGCSPTGAAS